MKKAIARIAAFTFLASPPAMADVGLGVKVGTLGLGAEGTIPLSPGINLRAGINTFQFEFTDTSSNIDYNFELELESYALLIDWHPFAGAFKLSGGLVSNKNRLAMDATPTGTVTIGNSNYPTGSVGTLHGEIDFKSAALRRHRLGQRRGKDARHGLRR